MGREWTLRIAYVVGFGSYLAVVSFLGWSHTFAYSQLSLIHGADPSTYALAKSLFNVAAYLGAAALGRRVAESRPLCGTVLALAGVLWLLGMPSGLWAASSPSWVPAILSAAVIAVGQALCFLAWQLVFAGTASNRPYRLPAFATAFGGALYLAVLQLFPESILILAGAALAPVSVAALVVCLVLQKRSAGNSVPAFSPSSARTPVSQRRLASSLAVFACFAFLWAMMRMYASAPSLESDALTVMGRLVSAALVLLAYRFLSSVDIMAVFRLAFPVLAVGFILLPVVDSTQFNVGLSALTYTAHSIISIVVLVECRALWRTFGLPTFTSVGVAWGVVGLATVAGRAVGELALDFSSVVTLVFVVIYGAVQLGFLGRQKTSPVTVSAASETSIPDAPESPDPADSALARFVVAYGLTPREEEVFSHLIRGRTSAQIAERMFVSKNTVLTHLKSIYRKADVHSKAEILDLYDERFEGQESQSHN